MDETWKDIESLRKELEATQIIITSRINQLNDHMVYLRNKLKREAEEYDRTQGRSEAGNKEN